MNGAYPVQQVTCEACGKQGTRQLRKRTKPVWFCSSACRAWTDVYFLYLEMLRVRRIIE